MPCKNSLRQFRLPLTFTQSSWLGWFRGNAASRGGPSFVVQIKTVLVLVIAEKLGEASPIDDRLEHFFGRLVGQQHREMLQNDLLLERAIFLTAQQPHEVGE